MQALGNFGLNEIVKFFAIRVLQRKKFSTLLFNLCLIGLVGINDFDDVSIQDLTRSWDDCFQMKRSWPEKPITISSWMPPLQGVLKLNFEGSFLKEASKGGYGGVIRNSFDTVYLACQTR